MITLHQLRNMGNCADIAVKDLAAAQERLDDHLEAQARHNMAIALKRIAIHDPVARETVRQRQIIDAALLSLTNGNTIQARQLLGEL